MQKEREILTYEWFIIWNFISHYYMGRVSRRSNRCCDRRLSRRLSLSESDIQAFLTADVRDRAAIRPSSETDQVEILSGILKERQPEPHFSFAQSGSALRDYGRLFPVTDRDMLTIHSRNNTVFGITGGGGRTSGRETIGRVAAGAVASGPLKTLGIKLTAFPFEKNPGPVTGYRTEYRLDEVTENPLLHAKTNGQKQLTISMR